MPRVDRRHAFSYIYLPARPPQRRTPPWYENSACLCDKLAKFRSSKGEREGERASWKIKSSGTTYQMHSSSLTYFCSRTENTRTHTGSHSCSSRLIFSCPDFFHGLLNLICWIEKKIWRNWLGSARRKCFTCLFYATHTNWMTNGAEIWISILIQSEYLYYFRCLCIKVYWMHTLPFICQLD